MKRHIVLFSAILLGLLQSPMLPAYAATSTTSGNAIAQPILPPIKQSNQTLFGENQYYSVIFRGNGEAVVNMKTILTNSTDSPLSSVTLTLPQGITADNVIAYQVIAQPQCIQYNYQQLTTKPTCLQYQPPNYQYVGSDANYQKIQVSQTGSSIQLTLPTAIAASDSGSYLLSYRTFNYTKKNFFGAFDAIFQTLKVNDTITSLQVGLSTDSDLYLKDAKGTVNYAPSTTSMAALSTAVRSGVQNPQFAEFYNQIGQGVITKNVSQLEPMESYTVKDSYADAGLKLYGSEIMTTVVSIIFVLAFVFAVAIFLLRRKTTTTQITNLRLFMTAAIGSFASVFIASLYTVGIVVGYTLLTNNSYYYTSSEILFLLLMAVSGAVYLFLIFMPTVVMLIKRGVIWGCITFGLTIMWVIIAGIALFGIFYLFSASNVNNPYPIIRPLMMSGQSTSSAPVPEMKAQ